MIVEHASELPAVAPGETAARWIRLGPDGHLERLIYHPGIQTWLGTTLPSIRGNDLWFRLQPEIVFAPDLQTEQYLGPKDSYWGDVSPLHVGAGYAAGMTLQYRQFAQLHDTNWDGAGPDFRMHCGAYLYDFDDQEQVPDFDVPPPTFGWARTEYLTSIATTNSWWVPIDPGWKPLVPFDEPTSKQSIYPAVYGYMDPGATVSGRMKNIVLEFRWAAAASEPPEPFMTVSNFLENAVLDKVFRNVDFTVASVWVAYHTADPGEDGANAEVSGNGYQRMQGTFGSPAASGAISNTTNIEWPDPTGAHGNVTHISLWDGSSGGNCLWYGQLAEPRLVAPGSPARILAGALDIDLD